MKDVYITYYKRTPFSRAKPDNPSRDVYNGVSMDVLFSKLIRDSLSTGINPEEIGEVITGCAIQAGENWTYGGRHQVLLSELPVSVPSMSIDRACSSSLNATAIGAMEIQTGNSDIVLAGGMEHMTHVPLYNDPYIKYNSELMENPRYSKYDMDVSYHVGLTAEKLAQINNISREEMDEFSYDSQRLTARSIEEGYFRDEILPVTVTHEGNTRTVDIDQTPRPNTTLEQMRQLKPAFKENGRVTAGNSPPLSSGASLLMIMSGKKLKEYGLKPLARVIDYAAAGVDPTIMGHGPVPATEKLLKKNNLSTDDIDYWEINEAFAVVALNAMKHLNIDRKRVNIHGGSIAIGHPLGATGARIAGTLARTLQEKKADIGVATLCVGGGQGYSLLIERV
ncbi:MAG: acetyl-CoA C-acetyltransferase [Ferroplasma sp.]